jgi:hypothetical protein
VYAERCDGLGDVGGGRTTFGSLLEQRHLTCKVGELALEVRKRFFRRPVGKLPDDAFSVAFPNIDGSRLIDATPRLLICRTSQEPHLAWAGCPRGNRTLRFSLLHLRGRRR